MTTAAGEEEKDAAAVVVVADDDTKNLSKELQEEEQENKKEQMLSEVDEPVTTTEMPVDGEIPSEESEETFPGVMGEEEEESELEAKRQLPRPKGGVLLSPLKTSSNLADIPAEGSPALFRFSQSHSSEGTPVSGLSPATPITPLPTPTPAFSNAIREAIAAVEMRSSSAATEHFFDENSGRNGGFFLDVESTFAIVDDRAKLGTTTTTNEIITEEEEGEEGVADGSSSKSNNSSSRRRSGDSGENSREKVAEADEKEIEAQDSQPEKEEERYTQEKRGEEEEEGFGGVGGNVEDVAAAAADSGEKVDAAASEEKEAEEKKEEESSSTTTATATAPVSIDRNEFLLAMEAALAEASKQAERESPPPPHAFRSHSHEIVRGGGHQQQQNHRANFNMYYNDIHNNNSESNNNKPSDNETSEAAEDSQQNENSSSGNNNNSQQQHPKTSPHHHNHNHHHRNHHHSNHNNNNKIQDQHSSPQKEAGAKKEGNEEVGFSTPTKKQPDENEPSEEMRLRSYSDIGISPSAMSKHKMNSNNHHNNNNNHNNHNNQHGNQHQQQQQQQQHSHNHGHHHGHPRGGQQQQHQQQQQHPQQQSQQQQKRSWWWWGGGGKSANNNNARGGNAAAAATQHKPAEKVRRNSAENFSYPQNPPSPTAASAAGGGGGGGGSESPLRTGSGGFPAPVIPASSAFNGLSPRSDDGGGGGGGGYRERLDSSELVDDEAFARALSERGSRAGSTGGRSDSTDLDADLYPPRRTLDISLAEMKTAQGLEAAFAKLETFTKDEINYFVLHSPLPELFSSAYRRRSIDKTSSKMRELSFLHYLTADRLADLEAAAIARIIRSLQRSGIRDSDQPAIHRLISSQTDADKLSLLKERLDPRGSYHGLHKLIYSDISDRIMRQQLLEHFAKSCPSRHRGVKIVSDIDDTLVCSGGSEVFKGTWAGVDRRLPPGTIYPGILQLLKELDLCDSDDGRWPLARLGNLVFLSARPHLYADWTERLSFQLFDRLVNEKRMHAAPSFLSGDLSSVSAVWNNMVPMAMKKVANFQQLVSIYPEYDYVFIGDNGQADLHVAEMIETWCRDNFKTKVNSKLRAIFIQQVQPRALTYRGPNAKYEGTRTEEEWKSKDIHFFRTFIGCATLAADLGHIHINGVYRVAKRALEEFDAIKFSSETQREAYASELNDDILAANAWLRSKGHNERQIPLISKTDLYVL